MWGYVIAMSTEGESWFVNGQLWSPPVSHDWEWVRSGDIDTNTVVLQSREDWTMVQAVYKFYDTLNWEPCQCCEKFTPEKFREK